MYSGSDWRHGARQGVSVHFKSTVSSLTALPVLEGQRVRTTRPSLSPHVTLVLSVRKSGYRQCVGYLLANTRLRLDDFYQFYPAEKLFDLFISALPTNNTELLGRESVNVSEEEDTRALDTRLAFV